MCDCCVHELFGFVVIVMVCQIKLNFFCCSREVPHILHTIWLNLYEFDSLNYNNRWLRAFILYMRTSSTTTMWKWVFAMRTELQMYGILNLFVCALNITFFCMNELIFMYNVWFIYCWTYKHYKNTHNIGFIFMDVTHIAWYYTSHILPSQTHEGSAGIKCAAM